MGGPYENLRQVDEGEEDMGMDDYGVSTLPLTADFI